MRARARESAINQRRKRVGARFAAAGRHLRGEAGDADRGDERRLRRVRQHRRLGKQRCGAGERGAGAAHVLQEDGGALVRQASGGDEGERGDGGAGEGDGGGDAIDGLVGAGAEDQDDPAEAAGDGDGVERVQPLAQEEVGEQGSEYWRGHGKDARGTQRELLEGVDAEDRGDGEEGATSEEEALVVP